MTKHLTIEFNDKVVKHRVAFTLLVKSQYLEELIDLENLVYFPFTPVPHMLRTPDGFFAKTKKASMLH